MNIGCNSVLMDLVAAFSCLDETGRAEIGNVPMASRDCITGCNIRRFKRDRSHVKSIVMNIRKRNFKE
jgi:hypothetical protein